MSKPVTELVEFNTQYDLFSGERVAGTTGNKVNGPRITGTIERLLVVCVDDMNPGWLNVKAELSNVWREGDKHNVPT